MPPLRYSHHQGSVPLDFFDAIYFYFAGRQSFKIFFGSRNELSLLDSLPVLTFILGGGSMRMSMSSEKTIDNFKALLERRRAAFKLKF